MEKLAQINERQVCYLWIKENSDWAELLPTKDWLVLPIGHHTNKQTIGKVAAECIKRDVNYVAAIGQACELIHDIFDEEIVWQKIQNGESVENGADFEKEPMTTWHHEFDEGVWFATTVAYNDYSDIDQVVCLDLTEKGEKARLVQLLSRIQVGWSPE